MIRARFPFWYLRHRMNQKTLSPPVKNKKPIITVPRQKKFKEHINDHQVEFALFLKERYGVEAILDVTKITPELLKKYKHIMKVKKDNLTKIQSYFKEVLNGKIKI